MSGQRETRFRVGPGGSVPHESAAPTIRAPGGVRHTVFQTTGRTGLEGLQDKLSGFFGGLADTVRQIEEVKHLSEIERIKKENAALAKDAVTDAHAGTYDPAKGERYSYQEAYSRTTGAVMGNEDVQEFLKLIHDKPRDGTFDIDAAAEEFRRNRFGEGTGDRDFDLAYISTLARGIDSIKQQFAQQQRETMLANQKETLQSEITGALQRGEVSPSKWLDYVQRGAALNNGDVGATKKWITSVFASAVESPEQAEPALAALRHAGYHEQFPDLYAAMEESAMKAVARVQSYEGMQRWFDIEARVEQDFLGGTMTRDKLADFTMEAADLFWRKGGMDAYQRILSKLEGYWREILRKEANVNLILAAHDAGKDGPRLFAAVGKNPNEVLNEYFEPAVKAIASRTVTGADGTPVPLYPGLLESMQSDGEINPYASPRAATDFAMLLASPAFSNASGGGMSANSRALLNHKLSNGNDEQGAANAYLFLSQYEKVVGPEHALRLLDDSTKGVYLAAKNALALGMDPLEYFRARKENPGKAAVLRDAATGQIDWKSLLQTTNKTNAELSAEVMKETRAALREALGRDSFFGAPDVSFGSLEVERAVQGHVATILYETARAGGKPDLGKAVEQAVKIVKDQFVALPGLGKSLILQADPFAGKGRALDSPVSTINGQNVYAPFPIRNAAGEIEDPMETFREDLRELAKSLPGLVDPSAVALSSMHLASDGVFPLTTAGGMPVTLTVGQNVIVPGEITHAVPHLALGGAGLNETSVTVKGETKQTIPEDPEAAREWIKARLGPGFHLIEYDGSMPGRKTWQIGYGFRVKVGKAEHDRMVDERRRSFDAARAVGRNDLWTLEGWQPDATQ